MSISILPTSFILYQVAKEMQPKSPRFHCRPFLVFFFLFFFHFSARKIEKEHLDSSESHSGLLTRRMLAGMGASVGHCEALPDLERCGHDSCFYSIWQEEEQSLPLISKCPLLSLSSHAVFLSLELSRNLRTSLHLEFPGYQKKHYNFITTAPAPQFSLSNLCDWKKLRNIQEVWRILTLSAQRQMFPSLD